MSLSPGTTTPWMSTVLAREWEAEHGRPAPFQVRLNNRSPSAESTNGANQVACSFCIDVRF
jgi:hypothetical protein